MIQNANSRDTGGNTVEAVEGYIPRSRKSQVLLSNFLFGAIRGLAYIAATLVTVRLLVRDMGIAVFGLLALTTPFLRYGWSGVFDFGLANACMRYTGRAFSEKDVEGINRYVNSSLFISFIAGAVVLSVFVLLRHPLAALIVEKQPQLLATATLILAVTIPTYVLYLAFNPLFGLLGGIHKLQLTHILGTLGFLLEAVGVFVLDRIGMTVPRLLALYAGICPVLVIFLLVMAKAGAPYLRLSLRRIDFTSVMALAKFTSQFSLTSVVGTILPMYDKFILASLVGISAVGYYEVAWRIVEWLKRVPQLFLVPALPLAADRSMEDPAALKALYARLLDFTILMSTPLFFIVIGLASPVIHLWTGPGTEMAALAVSILAAVHFCNTLTGPAASILAGTNRMKHLIIGTAAMIFLCVVLEPVLAKQAGFPGLLLGSLIGLGVVGGLGFVFYVQYVYPHLDISMGFSALAWAALAAAFPSTMAHWVFGRGWIAVSTPKVILVGIACLLTYTLLVSLYRPNRELLRFTAHEFGRTVSRLVDGAAA